MAKLEELSPGTLVEGIVPDASAEVINVRWYGDASIELTYKIATTGGVSNVLLYRENEEE